MFYDYGSSADSVQIIYVWISNRILFADLKNRLVNRILRVTACAVECRQGIVVLGVVKLVQRVP